MPLRNTITVTALKNGLGGEGKINITVTKAAIDLMIEQPELSNYDIGSKMNIRIKASYPNDTSIPGPVMVNYNNKEITLELEDDYFIGAYTLTPEDNGLATLIISYTDEYGNLGEVSKKITASGLITYYLISNWYFIVIGAVALGITVYFTKKKVVTASNIKELKKKKDGLEDNKKQLQEEYYVKQTIDKTAYEEEISKVDEELNITKGKIKDYEKNNKTKKKK